MVKRKGMVKKALASVAVTAVTCSFAMTAGVAAIPTYVVQTYSNVNLTVNQDFKGYDYLHGYYQIKTSSHEARTGTHVLAGKTDVEAFSNIKYFSTNNKILTYSGDYTNRGKVKGKEGWVLSGWLSLPAGTYSAVLGIEFCSRVFDSSGKECYIDKVTVNL